MHFFDFLKTEKRGVLPFVGVTDSGPRKSCTGMAKSMLAVDSSMSAPGIPP